jgi:hypothetical protein
VVKQAMRNPKLYCPDEPSVVIGERFRCLWLRRDVGDREGDVPLLFAFGEHHGGDGAQLRESAPAALVKALT